MADDMRTLGYICPKCGAQVMGARSAFALEASDAEIECSCGGSVLRTNYDGQNYHILVPCGVCGQTHEAVCPPERMLHAATALSCPDSRQFCCFIGDEGTVEHHLREASIAISKEKAQENGGEAEAFTDNVIMYEFLSELKDIAARPNGITCGCGSHDYSMEIRRDAVENFKVQKKNGELTEDDMKIAEKDIQKMTDDMCKEIDALLEKKEKELLAV